LQVVQEHGEHNNYNGNAYDARENKSRRPAIASIDLNLAVGGYAKLEGLGLRRSAHGWGEGDRK
jgi:hypothetical protein